MPPVDWKTKMRSLQRDLKILMDHDQSVFHHGILQIDGGIPQQFSIGTPCLYASGYCVLDRIVVPLSGGGNQLHLIFGETSYEKEQQALYKQFGKLLDDFHSILTPIPTKVLPKIKIPNLTNGAKENFARCYCFLHWVGAQEDQIVFNVYQQFARTIEDYLKFNQLSDWNEAPKIANWNPGDIISLTASDKKSSEYWKEQHELVGKKFPEIIASSLTKPILYALVNAIEFVLREGEEKTGDKTKFYRKSLANFLKREKLPAGVEKVLAAMDLFHDGKEPEESFLTQKEIGKNAGVSQTTVSNAIKVIFSHKKLPQKMPPHKRYKNCCEQGAIRNYLDLILYPSNYSECSLENPDELTDEASRKYTSSTEKAIRGNNSRKGNFFKED